jgi:hypothetical protein
VKYTPNNVTPNRYKNMTNWSSPRMIVFPTLDSNYNR